MKGSQRDAAITRLVALEHMTRARGNVPKRAVLESIRDELASMGLDFHREQAEALLARL